ncbi:MAG: alpha/beta hydrolase [Litorilinea sp.]
MQITERIPQSTLLSDLPADAKPGEMPARGGERTPHPEEILPSENAESLHSAPKEGLLSYRIEGQGPPLLLIHGFGISFKIWRNLLPHLTSHFRCVIIELPGIGQSPPPEPARAYYTVCAESIEQLRRYLRLEAWAVFSYSTGSRAAETYINRHPDRVSRAVFLCPVHVPGWRWMAARAAIHLDSYFPALGDWVLSGRRLHSLVRTLAFNGRGHPYANEWTREIGAQDINSLKRAIREMPNAGNSLLDLPVPALYVWGKYDLIPNRPRRRLRRQHAPIHRRILANHSAPELAAGQVADEVLPFLRVA